MSPTSDIKKEVIQRFVQYTDIVTVNDNERADWVKDQNKIPSSQLKNFFNGIWCKDQTSQTSQAPYSETGESQGRDK